jgi:hypothetical protein
MSAYRTAPQRSMALLLLLLGTACSTLPPQRPITDNRMVVGTWTGTFYLSRGAYMPGESHPYTITWKDDGTWHATSPSLKPGTFDGTWQITNGKMVWKSLTTGRTGTAALHEGDKRRVLRMWADDGKATAELTPAQ